MSRSFCGIINEKLNIKKDDRSAECVVLGQRFWLVGWRVPWPSCGGAMQKVYCTVVSYAT